MADNVELEIRAKNLTQDAFTAIQAALKALEDTSSQTSQRSSEAFGIFSKSIGDLGSSFVARVAEGVLLRDAVHELLDVSQSVIEAFPSMVEHTIAVGNSLYEMSLKTGASVEGLSALRYVASQTGIDFNSFGPTLTVLEKNLGAVGSAGQKVSDALGRMGLDLTTLKNERPDQAFLDIVTALGDIPNNADKANIAATLLGRGAKEMGALWHEDIGQMIQDAQDLGLVMSTDTASAAHAAEIGFQSLQMQVEAVGMKIGAAFLPAIIGLEQDLSHGLVVAVGTLNSSLGALGGDGGALSIVARAMGSGDDAVAAQTELYEKLKSAVLGFASGAADVLIPVIAYSMVGFNATEVILELVAQAINYLALGYEKASLALEEFGRLGTSGAARQTWDIQIAGTQGVIDGLNKEIAARASSIAADKKAETDWMTWSTDAQGAVKAAITAVGQSHTDVAGIVQRYAEESKDAYGGISTATDTATAAQKKFEAAVESIQQTLEGESKKTDETQVAIERVIASGNTDADVKVRVVDAIDKLIKAHQNLAPAVQAYYDANEAVGTQEVKWADTLEKLHEQELTAQQALYQVSLTQQLNKLAQTEQNEINSYKKQYDAGTINADQLGQATLAIQGKYVALSLAVQIKAMDARAKAILAGQQEIFTAEQALSDFTAQQADTTTDYQALKIQEVADKQIAAFKGTEDQRATYNAAIQALADDQVAGLYEDDAAIRDNSTTSLQQIADKAWATYEAMAADPENYSASTIAQFKKIAQAAQDSADGTKHAWSTAFDDMLAQLPSLVEQAFTGGGGAAGAAKAGGTLLGTELGKGLVSHLEESGAIDISTGLGSALSTAIRRSVPSPARSWARWSTSCSGTRGGRPSSPSPIPWAASTLCTRTSMRSEPRASRCGSPSRRGSATTTQPGRRRRSRRSRRRSPTCRPRSRNTT